MNSSASFFHDFADTFDTIYDGKRSPLMQWVDRRFRRDMFVRFTLTFDLLGDLSGKRILDIGCGSGPYIVEALKRGATHVTGIDPAPRMLELAKQRAAGADVLDSVTLIEGAFPQTRPDGSFDYAVVMGVMDYIAGAESFVQAAINTVSEGVVFSFPSTHWLRTPIRKIRYRLRNCPVYFYTDDKITGLMQKAGVKEFTIKKIPGAGMDYVVWVRV